MLGDLASDPTASEQIKGDYQTLLQWFGVERRLYYGERFTTVKDRKKDIGKGLLAAMLKQLGLGPEDL
jgi:hypothetical protein